MADEERMRKDLRALWKRDPALFGKIVRQYVADGSAAFPRDKRRRVKRQEGAMDWVWALVEFLRWRDGAKIKPACEHLSKHMPHFRLYDNESGRWRAGEEPEPPVFWYKPDGEGEGLTIGEGIRQTYYAAKEREDMFMAELILDEMKAAHDGEESALKPDTLPPPLKLPPKL